MDLVVDVKYRILQLVRENNISVNKLAEDSGLARSSLKNIIYGKSKSPKLRTIKILCDGLGITLAEFFDTKEFNELEQEIK